MRKSIKSGCKVGMVLVGIIVTVTVLLWRLDAGMLNEGKRSQYKKVRLIGKDAHLNNNNKRLVPEHPVKDKPADTTSLLWSSHKKDRPVRFLKPDGKNVDPKVMEEYKTNHRTSGKSSWNYMETRRMSDDYRFCVKTARFMGPLNFKTNTKNPCWTNHENELHCVPYFYVIGVSKAGTTDMYERIIKHPDVFYDSALKEKHFFDYKRYLDGDKDSVYYYSKYFGDFAKEVTRQIQTNGSSNMISGDGTPCYFFYSFYWPCYQGNEGLAKPRYTNADVIHNLYSGAKIILSLRDPVARLYSRYLTIYSKYNRLHNKTNTISPWEFHQKASRAVDLYQKCFREWSPRHCAYNGTMYALTGIRLQEGMYSVYLEDWLKVFPREQIKVIRFEDYIENPSSHMENIYTFLDLAPISNGTKIVGRKNGKKTKEPALRMTINMLCKFYSPFIRQVQQLLGSKEWTWGYDNAY